MPVKLASGFNSAVIAFESARLLKNVKWGSSVLASDPHEFRPEWALIEKGTPESRQATGN